jgi:hypothetical protein
MLKEGKAGYIEETFERDDNKAMEEELKLDNTLEA